MVIYNIYLVSTVYIMVQHLSSIKLSSMRAEMVSDLLTILAESRSFIDVHGMSEIKNNGVHLSQNLLFWRSASKDCISIIAIQSAAVLVTFRMPSDLDSKLVFSNI